jgi:hypothetical protein
MSGSCASCGVKEDDDGVNLRNCAACYRAQYCGAKCQKDHWPQHKVECKKRAAELRDEILFKQPESTHMGDCPICFLPFPSGKLVYHTLPCCSKRICFGCHIKNMSQEVEARRDLTCLFCRFPLVGVEEDIDDEKMDKLRANRLEKNDPLALHEEGLKHFKNGDSKTAVKYFLKAAELGDANSHFMLSPMYRSGNGVEKDMKKSKYHLEQAAIGGQPDARWNLAVREFEDGQRERAVKHFVIAAKQGSDTALEQLKTYHEFGIVSHDVFEEALRGHHAAVDATKSPQRDEAQALAKMLNL